MKKPLLTLAAAVGVISAAAAADYLWFNISNGVSDGVDISRVGSITYANGYDSVAVEVDGKPFNLATASLSTLTPITATEGNPSEAIEVVYDGATATVKNPYAFDGVSVDIDGAKVTVRSTNDNELTYHLTGTGTSAQFKLYSAKKYILKLDNVSITNDKGSAINSQSSKKGTIELVGSSTLVDSKKYSTPDGEDEKACLFSEGQLIFTGDGDLTVTGNKKHAVASDDYVEIKGGTLKVASAASDGIHANDYFQMSGGSYISANTTGDGIDADAGYIKIKDGSIDITLATADTKGLKCDSIMTMTGGDVKLTVTGDQCKGIRTKQSFTLSGGTITATLSGNVVVTDGDPSYCTAIKPQDFEMTGGKVNITHTGTAGKGFSIDGDATFTGGEVTVTASGNGAAYTNANNEKDSYSSTCISIDGTLTMLGGTYDLSNSGSAGKCIKVDSDATFGDSDHELSIVAKTTGAKILESGSTGGGGGGGWGPGGGGNSADYANPKVIKAEGNLTVNNGSFTLSAAKDGGEGLESKKILTINGGELKIETYDDCINAANSIVFNGGKTYCKASGNDAIDSNGTLTINGGLIVAIGTSGAECGFDCDNYTFKVTGGTFFGIGGSTSNPTTSACTQCCVKYTASVSANTVYTITKSDATPIMSFTVPSGTSGSRVMLFSDPAIVKSSTYKIYKAGTLSGGEAFENLTTGGSYTPGTQAASFTPSSMLTTAR